MIFHVPGLHKREKTVTILEALDLSGISEELRELTDVYVVSKDEDIEKACKFAKRHPEHYVFLVLTGGVEISDEDSYHIEALDNLSLMMYDDFAKATKEYSGSDIHHPDSLSIAQTILREKITCPMNPTRIRLFQSA